jgi:hypothetical protein
MDYNTAIATLMSSTAVGLVDGQADPFAAVGGIDAALSCGWMHDAPRKNIHPTRSKSTSIADYPFDSLSGWTNISGGTASATIFSDPTPDPAIGNAVDFQTGAGVGSSAGIQRVVGVIPDSFGVLLIDHLTAVGTNSADALHADFQTSAGANIRIRFRDSSVETFLSGTWQLLFAHGGAYWTEWWVEAKKEANGTYTVSLYAGTAKVGSKNGNAPGGAPGNNNLVWFQQLSGATANRRSKIAILQIGATQVPDAMNLVSVPMTAAFQPAIATALLLVENVSENLLANGNLWLSVSRDNGVTWMQAALSDLGYHGPGVIDPFKKVKILGGSAAMVGSGQSLRWRIETLAGSFLPIRGIAVWWE